MSCPTASFLPSTTIPSPSVISTFPSSLASPIVRTDWISLVFLSPIILVPPRAQQHPEDNWDIASSSNMRLFLCQCRHTQHLQETRTKNALQCATSLGVKSRCVRCLPSSDAFLSANLISLVFCEPVGCIGAYRLVFPREASLPKLHRHMKCCPR